MSDPPLPPRPQGLGPTLRFIVQSRKGIGAIVATITATGYALALTVSYWRGTLPAAQYWDMLQAPSKAIVAAWSLYVLATGYEDGREKGRTIETYRTPPDGPTP